MIDPGHKVYKKVIQSMLKSDTAFCPFRKEKQMDYVFASLAKDLKNTEDLTILDACCGYGRFMYFLVEKFPNQKYIGIDYVPELIKQAKEQFAGYNQVTFKTDDILSLSKKYPKKFDITINYKTLCSLPYYEEMVLELIKSTKSKIYITSLFYDGDIDFIVKIDQKATQKRKDSYVHLNTYSLPKFREFCLKHGAKSVKSTPMHIDVDLPKPKSGDMDELHTFTIPLKKSERLEITSTIVLNWQLIEITL